ncbi:MAG: prolipoprotein diacylglyceryl transferase, partial [Thermoleophilia bacterium]|nr:prolipoprotein diacylglyceryl transferase [Thermoleophilia bacterium]
MRRILWEWPAIGLRLNSFSVLMAVAVAAGVAITYWRARRERLRGETVLELAVWLLGGGILGARALYLAMHPEALQSAADLVRIWQGGIVYYGCLIGGLIGSTIYWVRRPFPWMPMADTVAPALALGSAIGRMGCWLNGCCHGRACAEGWGVAFPEGSLPWARQVADGLIPPTAAASLPIYPTQLYAAAESLVVLLVLTWYYPRRRRDGEVMALLMVLYAINRFAIESLRGDEGAVVLGLTLSQAISVVVLAGGVALWAWLLRQPAGRYADAPSIGDAASNTRSHRPRGAAVAAAP